MNKEKTKIFIIITIRCTWPWCDRCGAQNWRLWAENRIGSRSVNRYALVQSRPTYDFRQNHCCLSNTYAVNRCVMNGTRVWVKQTYYCLITRCLRLHVRAYVLYWLDWARRGFNRTNELPNTTNQVCVKRNKNRCRSLLSFSTEFGKKNWTRRMTFFFSKHEIICYLSLMFLSN